MPKTKGIRVKRGRVIARRAVWATIAFIAVSTWAARSLPRYFPSEASAAGKVEELFAKKHSDVVVEVDGVVKRALRDDKRGSRHQRFIMALDSGHTVLVAHNINLAQRVEKLLVGDSVRVRGEYEWTDKGGVLHWTHNDPAGRRPGGWIEHKGRRYR
jgi:hypothetical protein